MAAARTTFAKKLEELRANAAISQYALAQRAGLSKQALSRLELGERAPTWATVQALAKALGVTCEAFTEPPESSPAPRSQSSKKSPKRRVKLPTRPDES